MSWALFEAILVTQTMFKLTKETPTMLGHKVDTEQKMGREELSEWGENAEHRLNDERRKTPEPLETETPRVLTSLGHSAPHSSAPGVLQPRRTQGTPHRGWSARRPCRRQGQ